MFYGVCGFHCSLTALCLQSSISATAFRLQPCLAPTLCCQAIRKNVARFCGDPSALPRFLQCTVQPGQLVPAPGFSCSCTARKSGLVEFCGVLFCQPLGIMRRKDRSKQGQKTTSCTEQLDAESASCAAERMYSMTS